MDKNLTVSARALLTTGLVLLALAVAYLIGTGRGEAAEQPSESASPAAAADSRTLTMIGVGTATAVPDRLAFEVSVGLTRDDLDLALDETSVLMKDVLKALTDSGVAEADVRTTGLSMNPVYDYEDNSRVFRGYRVSQQLAVEADLDGAGKIVPAIIAAGGNAARVSDLRLQVGNPGEAQTEARDAAVSQARAKAEEYAAATGQELGEVITLTEVAADRDQDQYSETAAAYRSVADSAASVPIQAGESDLTARVQVVWELR